jgi:hypothetical protein
MPRSRRDLINRIRLSALNVVTAPDQLGHYAVLKSMYDLATFEDAVASFRGFLEENGHPTNVFWVFRDDVWKRPNDVLINYHSASKNLGLAKRVFDQGREKGLVEVHAVATMGDKVAATVWFPSFQMNRFRGGIAE